MPGRIITADVFAGLAELTANSIHCCITSPPYWGLRDYHLSPTVWGGDPEHAHEWGELIPGNNRGAHGGCGKHNPEDEYARAKARGKMCACGAWLGCLGLEPTPALFVEHIVQVFRAVRRVLRDDGTLWLNIGDTYATGGGQRGRAPKGERFGKRWDGVNDFAQPNRSAIPGISDKNLCRIPERVAQALQDDGWILRSTIIWFKPNVMPESVIGWEWVKCRVKIAPTATGNRNYNIPGAHSSKSTPNASAQWEPCPGCDRCRENDGLVLRKGSWRPTIAHEFIFMLAKTTKYFCDGKAAREPSTSGTSDRKKMRESLDRIGGKHKVLEDEFSKASQATNIGRKRSVGHPDLRNARNVWSIPTVAFPGKHFAVFPPEIPKRVITAATSTGGCCSGCGAPFAPVIARKMIQGYRATCKCGSISMPCTVLDPFLGSGTTLQVARVLGRDGIGIEANPKYVKMAEKRILMPLGVLGKPITDSPGQRLLFE